MAAHVLPFEKPIVDLVARVRELRALADRDPKLLPELRRLEDKADRLARALFAELSPWQKVQLSRHPNRPYTLDYIGTLFEDFVELAGDRRFSNDAAIVGGLARFRGTSCVVVGQQKGRGAKENVKRNFGMPKPEGYRKARRLMLLAERYNMPVLTLIDTPGAYPGVDSEARGINESIAENLAVMSRLRTPIIATVTGEGNSGGAIAIGVCDHLNMLQYSTYFVISPEGCATILWKSSEHKAAAAEAMGVTSSRLEELGIVDQTIAEPLGGAHRDMKGMAERLKAELLSQVDRFSHMDMDELLERRYRRLMSHGAQRAR